MGPRRILSVLSSREAAVFGALARALFPRDRSIDLDEDDTGVVAYLDDYAGRLPASQRQNLKALVVGCEAAWLAWNRNPGQRIADAPSADVLQFIDAWSRNPNYPIRQAWLAVKSLLAFAYVENPLVMDAIGIPRGTN